MKELGQILGTIKVAYDEVVNNPVLQPVGTTAYTLKNVSVDAQNTTLKVFDVPAKFEAGVTADVTILGAGATISPFDATSGATPPPNSSFAQIAVNGNLSAGASGNVAVPLSFSAAAAAKVAYNHYVVAGKDEVRLAALTRLIASAQLPQLEPLATLGSGEASTFEATLSFDLGIKAKYGSSFDLAHTLSLFDGLSAQLTANVQYSIEASLGWSMFEEMNVAVGRVQQLDPNRVRVRIDRCRKNSFTLGATFALQIAYDASSIATVLEKAFDASPLPRALGVLKTVGSGNWTAIQASITDRAANELISLIAGTGWKQKAASSPEVKEALEAINKTVAIYNSIDDKVAQLWSELLLRVGVGPDTDLRKTIDTIAALDPAKPNLQQFLSPEMQKDLQMLEALTGKSLEEMIVGSSATLQLAIKRAVKLAKQLQRVITETPTTVNNAIQKFAKDNGIQSAIQWIAANATSLDKIQQYGDAQITKIVTKAVGKAFSEISAQDLEKVQAWAQKLVDEWNDLSAKLTAAAKYLKGTLGFNVSLELSRVSEYSAVLDFEVDPANAAARNAVQQQLPSGSVRGMLAALAAIEADDHGNLPYTIREALVISRHLRTGVTTVLLSLLGWSKLQKVTGTQFDESVLRTTTAGRIGSYSGGFTQTVAVDNATSECSVWIASEANDDLDQDDQFDTVSRSFRLTFARRDASSSNSERAALQTLLSDLGFLVSTSASMSAIPAGAETVFALDIGLDESAIQTFLANDGQANWNIDYRNAAYRLL
ncbi:MAG TPA: hypothetical protein VF846_03425, partial [Thermoanaerobaculia bacterium]